MVPAAAALCLGFLPGPCVAGSVYRCIKDGSVAYTQRADDPSCQPIEVNAHEPDPEEAARQQDELRKWREDRGKLAGQRRERRTVGRARSKNGRGDEPQVTPAEGGDSLKLPPELDFKSQEADSRN
jgi:hypothetical protein